MEFANKEYLFLLLYRIIDILLKAGRLIQLYLRLLHKLKLF